MIMIPPNKLPIVLRVLQAVLSLLTLVSAGATNYTVDYTNFTYYPASAWKHVYDSMDASGSGHMRTNVPHASANITYNFTTVYVVSAKWPYTVVSFYVVDYSPTTFQFNMQDDSVRATNASGNATIEAAVVGSWTCPCGVNQQHTILVTVPPGADQSGMSSEYAVVDQFIFEVLDDPFITSIPSTSTSQTSTSSASSSSSTSPSSSMSPSSSPVSGGHHSTTDIGALAISVGIVGALIALLLLFLLWRFRIRRQNNDKNRNIDPVTPSYPLLPIARIGTGTFPTSIRESPRLSHDSDVHDPLNPFNDQSALISDDLGRPSITLNYDPSTASTSYTNQPLSSSSPPLPRSPLEPPPYHRLSTPSMTTDSASRYSSIPTLDDPTVASNRDNKEKSGIVHLTYQPPRDTVGAASQDELELISTAIPEETRRK